MTTLLPWLLGALLGGVVLAALTAARGANLLAIAASLATATALAAAMAAAAGAASAALLLACLGLGWTVAATALAHRLGGAYEGGALGLSSLFLVIGVVIVGLAAWAHATPFAPPHAPVTPMAAPTTASLAVAMALAVVGLIVRALLAPSGAAPPPSSPPAPAERAATHMIAPVLAALSVSQIWAPPVFASGLAAGAAMGLLPVTLALTYGASAARRATPGWMLSAAMGLGVGALCLVAVLGAAYGGAPLDSAAFLTLENGINVGAIAIQAGIGLIVFSGLSQAYLALSAMTERTEAKP